MSLDFWTINFIKCVQFEQNISKQQYAFLQWDAKLKRSKTLFMTGMVNI